MEKVSPVAAKILEWARLKVFGSEAPSDADVHKPDEKLKVTLMRDSEDHV